MPLNIINSMSGKEKKK